MNMILTRAVKVKLETTPNSLLPTIEAYTTAYNHVCQTGWNDSDCNGFSLHHKTYQQCKTWLPSQLSVSSRMKAAESLKSVRTRKRKGLKVSCPQSKQCSIRYDANSYNVWFDKNILSISTVDGRGDREMSKPKCIVNANGDKEWRLDDKRHREDGPAVEYADGDKEWYINGKLHRIGGPAVENTDGSKEWYLNGVKQPILQQ